MPRMNEGSWDRVLRALGGLALFWVAFVSGLVSGVWAVVVGVGAILLLATAAVGFCPAYLLFGIDTCPTGKG